MHKQKDSVVIIALVVAMVRFLMVFESSLFSAFSAILPAMASCFFMLVLDRVMKGIGIGKSPKVVVMYVAEIHLQVIEKAGFI